MISQPRFHRRGNAQRLVNAGNTELAHCPFFPFWNYPRYQKTFPFVTAVSAKIADFLIDFPIGLKLVKCAKELPATAKATASPLCWRLVAGSWRLTSHKKELHPGITHLK